MMFLLFTYLASMYVCIHNKRTIRMCALAAATGEEILLVHVVE